MDNKLLTEQFRACLVKQDLSEASVKGYLYDLHYFHVWIADFYQQDVSFLEITLNDIRAYREYLSKIARQKPATINRRLQTVKRFYQIGCHRIQNDIFSERIFPTWNFNLEWTKLSFPTIQCDCD